MGSQKEIRVSVHQISGRRPYVETPVQKPKEENFPGAPFVTDRVVNTIIDACNIVVDEKGNSTTKINITENESPYNLNFKLAQRSLRRLANLPNGFRELTSDWMDENYVDNTDAQKVVMIGMGVVLQAFFDQCGEENIIKKIGKFPEKKLRRLLLEDPSSQADSYHSLYSKVMSPPEMPADQMNLQMLVETLSDLYIEPESFELEHGADVMFAIINKAYQHSSKREQKKAKKRAEKEALEISLRENQ